ncbi:hypothetical protein TGP89_420460 [Toxoplasma gondii p89]|uniref:Uncharacterized protein n=1 Tax=Toxoplasma gondii p89 TaxID=943119 RepID=A0A086JM91_TOXGO|nr:hypothetical protein TGP89_420460 [Toxoplasma gondii p89]
MAVCLGAWTVCTSSAARFSSVCLVRGLSRVSCVPVSLPHVSLPRSSWGLSSEAGAAGRSRSMAACSRGSGMIVLLRSFASRLPWPRLGLLGHESKSASPSRRPKKIPFFLFFSSFPLSPSPSLARARAAASAACPPQVTACSRQVHWRGASVRRRRDATREEGRNRDLMEGSRPPVRRACPFLLRRAEASLRGSSDGEDASLSDSCEEDLDQEREPEVREREEDESDVSVFVEARRVFEALSEGESEENDETAFFRSLAA